MKTDDLPSMRRGGNEWEPLYRLEIPDSVSCARQHLSPHLFWSVWPFLDLPWSFLIFLDLKLSYAGRLELTTEWWLRSLQSK